MARASKRTARQMLLHRAAQHAGFVAVETGGGFDGEGFVSAFIASFADHGVVTVDLDDPDAVEDNAVPGVAVIRAPLVAGLRGWRDTVIRRMSTPAPTLVVLPPGVSADALLRETVPAFVVDTAALTLQADDVAELIASVADDVDTRTGQELRSQADGLGEVVNRLGDGWPAWAHACATGFANQSAGLAAAVAMFGTPAFQSTVVSRHLAPFSARDVAAMAQLAHFSTFSAASAAAVAGLDFAETVLPHAPGLTRTPAGLYRFVEPVRAYLTNQHRLEPEAAELVAPTLIGEGEVILAANALVSAGLVGHACQLVDALPGAVLDCANQRELLAVLRVLSTHAPTMPGLPLKIARAHGNLAELTQSVQECERVLKLTEPKSALWLEAATERIWHRHRLRSIEEAEAEQELVELRAALASQSHSAPELAAASTRLREVEAGTLGQSRDVRVVQRSAEAFAEAAAEWESQGEKLRAARTWRGAASGPLDHLGHYKQAQRCLDKAAKLAMEQNFDFGATLGLKARYDALCADRAAFAESYHQARFIIEGSGIDWLFGTLLWSKAIDASWDGDAMEIDRCFRASKELLGDHYHVNAVILHSDIAERFAVIGEHDRAVEVLEAVRPDRHLDPVVFGLAEVTVLARSGDYEAAEQAWSVLDASGAIPNDRRWRALAEIQAASPSMDADIVEVVKRDSDRLRLSHLVQLLTPALVDADMKTSDRTVAGADTTRVTLLGGVRVSAGGAKQSELGPKTKAAQLLGLLAMRGGTVSVDAVSEELWPGVELKVGARRLKNVLQRLRDNFGDDFLLRADGLVRFGDVRTDIDDFSDLSMRVKASRRTSPQQARRDAIAALETYAGPFLEGQDDSLDVQAERVRLHNEAQALIDYLVAEHEPNDAWLASTRERVDVSDHTVHH